MAHPTQSRWGTAFILPIATAILFVANCSEADERFGKTIQPLFAKYCVGCHNQDDLISGIRLDHLDGEIPDARMKLWEAVESQIRDGAMPPEDEPQPTAAERKRWLDWTAANLQRARKRKRPRNGAIRRLTVAQYRNTLRDLLGLEEDLTDVLPPDALSKEGFRNHQQTLLMSPLLVEAYFDIAEKALDRCIVDPDKPPVIQTFRMDLGEQINPAPLKEKLILGANSWLLNNADFQVTELSPKKPFAYEPLAMRRKFRFNEGYAGNSTVRGWRDYDSIYHAVFACMRGSTGYPKGEPVEAIPEGILLRPAIPSSELFGKSSTYGPQANFKISLRQLPEYGNFQVRVHAAAYADGLLLDASRPLVDAEDDDKNDDKNDDKERPKPLAVDTAEGSLTIPQGGIYQIDIHFTATGKKPAQQAANSPWAKRTVRKGTVTLETGGRRFTAQLRRKNSVKLDDGVVEFRQPFVVLRLEKGKSTFRVKTNETEQFVRAAARRLADDSPLAEEFKRFESRRPKLGVHMGLRRDCGSTLARVGPVRDVARSHLADSPSRPLVFAGAINNYPRPYVEPNNPNYLAGVREIGVRCEYTDGRDTPRLLLRSVEFEGPYFEQWPPKSHTDIFIDAPSKDDPEQRESYARLVLTRFATRAFRRPVTKAEIDNYANVWRESFDATDRSNEAFRRSVGEALVMVLTSPQFLFLIETSATPDAEPLGEYELASKLSYFLWNGPPDGKLLQLAADGRLRESLDSQLDRMVNDGRFTAFTDQFASQWMELHKFEVVETDRKKHPRLTRDIRTELRQETAAFLTHLFRENLSADNVVRSDFVIANEVTASYYGLGSETESGFQFVPIAHKQPHLGGILTQASVLAGLSDGREPNPIKRGAWFARKIIAKPPADPPPNVPQVDESDHKLSLREKLLRHRDQEGCRKCHEGIDPWGLPFEQYDAGGLFQPKGAVASSKLPDTTEVESLNDLRDYLLEQQRDQVAFSLLKHLATYGIGRTLNYNEIESLKANSVELKQLRHQHYPMRDMLRFIIQSDFFLTK